MSPTPKPSKTEFGKLFIEELESQKLSHSDVARALGKTQSYVSRVARGDETASAKWVNMIADITMVPRDRRILMHRAAAKDNGYDIDLNEK